MAEPSAPLSADAQCDLIEHIRDQMGEVLDDLSGWDRSLWTQEARLKEAIDILTETLPQLDRLAAAVREREARGAALVKVIERAEGPMHMYYEEHHKDGHNCQCLICMTVNHYDREAMSGADGLSKAREALAAGDSGEVEVRDADG
jgi:hypothetical protein